MVMTCVRMGPHGLPFWSLFNLRACGSHALEGKMRQCKRQMCSAVRNETRRVLMHAYICVYTYIYIYV